MARGFTLSLIPPARIVRVTVKGQKNRKGAPLRTDFGLGGADVVTLNQARERALEYRRMAKSGLNPRFNAKRDVPTLPGTQPAGPHRPPAHMEKRQARATMAEHPARLRLPENRADAGR